MYLYLITNLINNKKYIGITNNYKKRWANHCSKSSKKSVINSAIMKHGKENFKFEVLLSNIPIDEIDDYEIEYIKKYESHVDTGKGYNVAKGGRYNSGGLKSKYGADNNNAHLTEEEVKYIKSHRNEPIYLLYENFSDKITYGAFSKVYHNKTYTNIEPTVDIYPYNLEFSTQFTNSSLLTYEEVVELRKAFNNKIPWKTLYDNKYNKIYSNEMSFWQVYMGNSYKLVMPEVFTKENIHFQSSVSHSGENNGKAKLTEEEVKQMRKDFESGTKTRKEIQEEYKEKVTSSSINNILRYRTWKYV